MSAGAESNAVLSGMLAEILSARLHARPVQPNLLPAVDDLVAWQDLMKLAHSERVSPLMYAALKDSDVCPPAVLEQLKSAYYEVTRYNLLLGRVLAEILRALHAAGVEVIVLKGMALMESLYRNPGLRPVTDMDILIRAADVPAALEALQGLGWTPTADTEPFLGAEEDYRTEMALQNPRMTTLLDLHWGLLKSWFYKRSIRPSDLWDSARPLPERGADTRQLGLEAGLVFLGAHWFRHDDQELLWLHDIALTVTAHADEIDWQRVLAYTRAWGLVLSVRAALRRATAELAAPVPEDVMRALESMRPSLGEWITYYGFVEGRAPSAVRNLAFMLQRRGWRSRAKYIFAKLFPPPEYMIERYHIRHRWLLPLHYPYRIIAGLWRKSSPRKPA